MMDDLEILQDQNRALARATLGIINKGINSLNHLIGQDRRIIELLAQAIELHQKDLELHQKEAERHQKELERLRKQMVGAEESIIGFEAELELANLNIAEIMTELDPAEIAS